MPKETSVAPTLGKDVCLARLLDGPTTAVDNVVAVEDLLDCLPNAPVLATFLQAREAYLTGDLELLRADLSQSTYGREDTEALLDQQPHSLEAWMEKLPRHAEGLEEIIEYRNAAAVVLTHMVFVIEDQQPTQPSPIRDWTVAERRLAQDLRYLMAVVRKVLVAPVFARSPSC